MASPNGNVSREGFIFGEFTAAIVALTLYMPNIVAAVISKHIAVALNIPKRNTGIYFSKLHSTMSLVSLGCSSIVYVLKWIISENNNSLALVTYFFVWLSRLMLFLIMFRSDNMGLWFYGFMVLSAFSMGLFQMTFFSLTVYHVTTVGLTFRLSRLFVWLLQVILDITIPSRPLLMVKIHLFMILFTSTVALCLWTYSCYKGLINAENGDISSKESVVPEKKWKCTNAVKRNKKLSLTHLAEPSIYQHLGNALSPLLMCFVPQVIRCFLYPSILPYSLLDRDLCHFTNMLITPISVLGACLVHCLKLYVPSIGRRWTWHWNIFWVLAIPMVGILVCILSALHGTDARLSKYCMDSIPAASTLVALLFSCSQILEALGYLGVAANVKHNGKMLNNGLKVVSTNQFIFLILNVISYKLSVGYCNTREKFVGSIPCYLPTNGMSLFSAFLFWFSGTVSNGYEDFLNEFNFNIREYV
ncbi:hypothetical protein BEWA_006620 [Theileria equi strain WA]|uniref:Uncharacterized protein n=1 Tax=Theileria equi strain WA TaxID=1537102 RepID=L0B166_THEEQ|nr:hypothetical protein BEWA_006620 [Theileria equi strain WA]AFZ81253.1 hypothetical protein BEWA_006620 [Theileria equi strain WA]|eukprot:XP_004830919.1 hypothetical protein BEWA_006620 [Theileria equi strain WA]